MDAENMSPEELEALARKKREEENHFPIQEGFLSCDLYTLNLKERSVWGYGDGQLISKETLDKLREQLGIFTLPKGTRFIKYKQYGWYDEDEAVVEEAGDDFARLYLENIRDIKKP